jgi:hypothetical protein
MGDYMEEGVNRRNASAYTDKTHTRLDNTKAQSETQTHDAYVSQLFAIAQDLR